MSASAVLARGFDALVLADPDAAAPRFDGPGVPYDFPFTTFSRHRPRGLATLAGEVAAELVCWDFLHGRACGSTPADARARAPRARAPFLAPFLTAPPRSPPPRAPCATTSARARTRARAASARRSASST